MFVVASEGGADAVRDRVCKEHPSCVAKRQDEGNCTLIIEAHRVTPSRAFFRRQLKPGRISWHVAGDYQDGPFAPSKR